MRRGTSDASELERVKQRVQYLGSKCDLAVEDLQRHFPLKRSPSLNSVMNMSCKYGWQREHRANSPKRTLKLFDEAITGSGDGAVGYIFLRLSGRRAQLRRNTLVQTVKASPFKTVFERKYGRSRILGVKQ